MAQFCPPLSVIENMKTQPTEGEWKLLRFLAENYDNSYEVYFQPFLNEARPDVVLMRKGGGVMIFEVKDWNLSNYKSTPSGTWIVKANGDKMRFTPVRQVASYKEKIYSLNSSELFQLRTIEGESRCWSVVNCAVFFHKSSEAQVRDLCYPQNITEKNKKFLRYITLLGDDSLTKKKMDGIFYKNFIARQSYYFTDDVYHDLRRLFKPDIHTVEQGIKYDLSPAQVELSTSVAGARKRIKGVAGAGKSFVLARRAINAHKRTGGNVLILTYNITLKNYLHDRMSEVRENFDWGCFHIENYHQLFNSMLARCSKTVPDIARAKHPELFKGCDEDDVEKNARVSLPESVLEEVYADGSIFNGHEAELTKYDVILIDEAQDYREEWVRIIMKFVANEGAEVVAFADEKQNVYERMLDENKFPVIPITTGPWDRKLNTSYRLNTKISELAKLYQNKNFLGKYDLDEHFAPAQQLELIFGRSHIEYHSLPALSEGSYLKSLANYIRQLIKAYELHMNDVTVLSSSVDLVRKLGDVYSKLTKEKVNCMCETQEEFDKMSGDRIKIKEARRFKKQNFWQNTGRVSFSSIHSFKGLESTAVILIVGDGVVDNGDNSTPINLVESQFELTYVGVTRARNYLFVINIGDEKYDKFFNSDEVKKLLDGVSVTVEGEASGASIIDTVQEDMID